MSSLKELLAAAPWMRGLTAAQRSRIEAQTVARNLPKGGYACRNGEAAQHWIGVIDGLLKMVVHSPEGKETTVVGFTTGGWFGEGSLLKDEPRRYDAVALRDSQVAYLPRATFLSLYDTSLEFSHFLVTQLNERLGQLIGRMTSDRLLDPNERVALCLTTLYHPLLYPGTERTLPVSQEEIGHLAGLSRPRVNYALKILENAGLLRVEHRRITILNLEGLKQHQSGSHLRPHHAAAHSIR